jgi:hypothetical protein
METYGREFADDFQTWNLRFTLDCRTEQKKARSEKPQPGRRATKTKTDYMTSKMKYLAATLGYQIIATSIVPKASPSNVLIGGLVPVSPGFPIEAFGNDGL